MTDWRGTAAPSVEVDPKSRMGDVYDRITSDSSGRARGPTLPDHGGGDPHFEFPARKKAVGHSVRKSGGERHSSRR